MEFNMLASALGRFRLVALLEGTSYLLLLLVAVPLKRLAGMPLAVTIVGSIHGALFLAFMVVLLHVWIEQKWAPKKAALAFVASVLPGGAFWFDRHIANEMPVED
jgi:integral membrane protein